MEQLAHIQRYWKGPLLNICQIYYIWISDFSCKTHKNYSPITLTFCRRFFLPAKKTWCFFLFTSLDYFRGCGNNLMRCMIWWRQLSGVRCSMIVTTKSKCWSTDVVVTVNECQPDTKNGPLTSAQLICCRNFSDHRKTLENAFIPWSAHYTILRSHPLPFHFLQLLFKSGSPTARSNLTTFILAESPFC